MPKTYVCNELFYSLQGEGVRAGTANVFVRFAGCNLQCRVEPGELSPGGFDCDTEFTSGRKLTADDIVDECKALVPTAFDPGTVGIIFTGGEPGMQLDQPLVEAVKAAGFLAVVETNGTYDLNGLGLDWITVSPKVAEHALKQLVAQEVKYVRNVGQVCPKTRVDAVYRLISPAFGPDGVDPRTLAWCIQLVRENPEWRLSVQQHKAWRVR